MQIGELKIQSLSIDKLCDDFYERKPTLLQLQV